jgi:hypothetical protein
VNPTEDIITQLHHEADIGNKALHAYQGYFKEYYDTKCNALYELFLSAEHDEEALQIRGTLTALNEMNEDLLQKIETGNLARKQLGN